MSTIKKIRESSALAALLFVAAIPFAAAHCSSSDAEDPAPSIVPVPTTQPAGSADAGPDVEVPDASCFADSGCFQCAPKKDDEFLNRCTTGTCSPFDNAKRVPLYVDGKLPPL